MWWLQNQICKICWKMTCDRLFNGFMQHFILIITAYDTLHMRHAIREIWFEWFHWIRILWVSSDDGCRTNLCCISVVCFCLKLQNIKFLSWLPTKNPNNFLSEKCSIQFLHNTHITLKSAIEAWKLFTLNKKFSILTKERGLLLPKFSAMAIESAERNWGIRCIIW